MDAKDIEIDSEYMYLGNFVAVREIYDDTAIIETRFGQQATISVNELTPKPPPPRVVASEVPCDVPGDGAKWDAPGFNPPDAPANEDVIVKLGAVKTVGELIEVLTKLPPDMPVEFDGKWDGVQITAYNVSSSNRWIEIHEIKS